MADGPFSGAFLPGLVKDDVHQRLSGFRVLLLEDVRSDLDQERVQLSLVPVAEDLRKFVRARIDDGLENGIGLADELHVAVLDAVMDHFHIVTGAVWSHVAAARLALGDRGDLRVDRRERLPAFLGASRHDGRALQSAPSSPPLTPTPKK